MWREDITLLVYSQARLFCRNEARKVNESGAKGVASHKTVNAVVSMARCDRRVATASSNGTATLCCSTHLTGR